MLVQRVPRQLSAVRFTTVFTMWFPCCHNKTGLAETEFHVKVRVLMDETNAEERSWRRIKDIRDAGERRRFYELVPCHLRLQQCSCVQQFSESLSRISNNLHTSVTYVCVLDIKHL